jgi:LysR family transcriptional regulator, glycine cleavage system transcriptional activator
MQTLALDINWVYGSCMAQSPPLQAVKVFEAVARHSNLTRAAAELNMTQSAVSYQIKIIEEFAGTALFERQARGVALTDEGRRIFPAVQQGLRDIRSAFHSLRDEHENLLVISTMQTIASSWLAPRLGTLQMSHPELAVRLEISSELADLAGGSTDIAIRSGKGNWPGVTSHFLLDQMFVCVASPSYLAREGRPMRPDDILDHVLVAPTDHWWPLWLDAAGYKGPMQIRRPGVDVDTQQMTTRMTLAGQGISLATPAFIQQELAQGQLVQLFDIEASSGLSYYIAYATARASSRKIRIFRDWALAEVAKQGQPNAD